MGTTPQPPRPPAAPLPPNSGSSAVAIALLVLVFIVVVSLFGVWIGFRLLARGVRIHVNNEGGSQKEVTIQTPFGGIEVNKQVNEASLGLPLYPGAKPLSDDEHGANINMNWGNEASLRIVAAKFHTADSLDTVKDYYQKRLTSEMGPFTPKNIEVHTDHWGNEEGNFVGKDHEGKTVFEIERKDYMKIAALKSELGGTRIELVNIRHGKEEPN